MNTLLLSAALRRVKELDLGLQYLGIVPGTDLITPSQLSTLVGLSAGTLISSTDWLKFEKNGKVRYISRGPMRYGMTWNHIHLAGVTYGKEVTIDGKRYICRLVKGADNDPTGGSIPANEGEFNELFYAICNGRAAGYTGPILANLTTTQCGFLSTRGFAPLCQETRNITASARLQRNTTKGNIATASFAGNTYASDDSGWWPVLEEVI